MILILIIAILLVAAISTVVYFSTKIARENFCSPGAAELSLPLYVINRAEEHEDEDDDADKEHECDTCNFAV